MSTKRPLANGSADAPRFTSAGALRSDFGQGGRVHIDRPLPFIVLHRFDRELKDDVALGIAATSPAYAIWPPGDEDAAHAMIDAVIAEQSRHFAKFLIVTLTNMPRPAPSAEDEPSLPPFVVEVAASPDGPAQAAARKLSSALAEFELDLRTCEVGEIAALDPSSGSDEIFRRHGECSHVSVELPNVHMTPDGRNVYPQLFHELKVEVFDALLKSAYAFMESGKLGVPAHHRALGRSSFVDAARAADAKLDRICAEFDFLMAVSPINASQALAEFTASGCEKAPEFHYRPLTVDPDEAKRELFRIDLKRVEDPVLETLFAEKRQEIDHQLTMLSCRNTERFRYASLMLYDPVSSALLDAALQILSSDRKDAAAGRRQPADCHAVAEAARAMAARYRAQDEAFEVGISIRDDVTAGMLVSGNRLYVSHDICVPAHRLQPLLHHEVGVHLLTFVNGSRQGLAIFKRGLAGYEGVQEGLGVFAEWAVGGLTRARLRLIAARVVAVHAMTDGAGFVEVFRLLRRTHGFSARGAFNITARVFRSGGFAKDAIYLRGFKTILDLIAAGEPLEPYWYGKIAPRHVPVVAELSDRGLLRSPKIRPEFLASSDADQRITAFRSAPSFADLL
jgi:uncharacterized protein (TIGR02421 family)